MAMGLSSSFSFPIVFFNVLMVSSSSSEIDCNIGNDFKVFFPTATIKPRNFHHGENFGVEGSFSSGYLPATNGG